MARKMASNNGGGGDDDDVGGRCSTPSPPSSPDLLVLSSLPPPPPPPQQQQQQKRKQKQRHGPDVGSQTDEPLTRRRLRGPRPRSPSPLHSALPGSPSPSLAHSPDGSPLLLSRPPPPALAAVAFTARAAPTAAATASDTAAPLLAAAGDDLSDAPPSPAHGAPATPEAPAPPLPLTALPSTELIPASATVTAPSAIPAAAAVSAAAHAHRGTASHHHLGAMRSLPAQPALREDPHGPHLRPFFPKLPTGAYEPFILDASGESREQSDDGPSRSTAAVQVPASINRYLRSYQREGIQFLYRLYKQRLGGLVCDDMGLGKTIQVIGFLAALFSKSGLAKDEVLRRDQVRRDKAVFPPVLVVCPTSVIFNWRNEFRTWGYFTVDVFHGTHIRRADVLKQAKQQHLEVVITSFATFRNQAKELQDVDWAMVIVDEVHQLKDPTSKITGAMKEFRAKCKFGLTGTAIQNRYSDLWCLLDWCNEGSVGTRAAFEREIAGPLRQGQSYSASNRDIARGREVAVRFRDAVLSRFLLRRTKKLIADQLPKKEDKVVFCPMTKRQETAYQNILHSPDFQLLARKDEPCDCAKARNDPRHKRGKCCYQTTSTGEPLQKLVLPALVTLQKVANHLALIMPDKSDPKEKQQKDEKLVSIAFGAEARRFTYDYMNMRDANNCGKWKILDELLTLWHQHGSKVLIFSHSLKLLGMLEEMVRLRGYGFLRIDGSMTAAERADRVERFNADAAGGVFVFLISARAGGVGINLTAANVVVIFDPSWNPSHDLQAQDRAYRIGQARDVSVFRFIAAGSIEEIVYGRQLYKQQQANIGYNASEERRLFEGIEGDAKRKGELFGMENLLAYESRSEVITKLIIDKVDRAEADYVVRDLAHVEDEPDDDGDGDGDGGAAERPGVDDEDEDDDGGGEQDDGDGEDGRGGNDDERSRVGTTAACKRRKRKDAKVAAMTADPDEDLPTLEMRFKPRPPARQKSSMQLERDRVAAILLGNDVEYTHANADVLGSSKIERQITENAKKAVELGLATQQVVFEPRDGGRGGGRESDVDDSDERIESEITPAMRSRIFAEMARFYGMPRAEFAEIVLDCSRAERQEMLAEFREKYHREMAGRVEAEENVEEEETAVDGNMDEVAEAEEERDASRRASRRAVRREGKRRRGRGR